MPYKCRLNSFILPLHTIPMTTAVCRWARAMQMAIGAGLETFLVHNMQDASLLREIAQQAGYALQHFSVVKTNFDIPPHK